MRLILPFTRRTLASAGVLVRDRKGVALVEFAYVLPVLTALGFYGLEVTNLALANLRVSQIASNLADTAARVGEDSNLQQKQIRESDINDAFQAVRLQGAALKITERGRIILSSLERNGGGGQWIHWQRCIGQGRYNSSFGREDDGKTGTRFPGMGPTGKEVTAPVDSAVMFVEVAYPYQPLISNALVSAPVIRARAAFLVRQQRDLDEGDNPTNPSPAATRSLCSAFTS